MLRQSHRTLPHYAVVPPVTTGTAAG